MANPRWTYDRKEAKRSLGTLEGVSPRNLSRHRSQYFFRQIGCLRPRMRLYTFEHMLRSVDLRLLHW